MGRSGGGAVWRRVRWPGPWPAAGASLALAGAAEAVLRTHGSGAVLSLAILVDAAATFPLVLARDRITAAAVTITAGTAAACVLHGGAAVAPLAALIAVWSVLVRRRITARRARAAELDASRRAFESTLLEHTARGERARIARELHDVVSHSVAVMVSQAEGARMMAGRDPSVVVPALDTIARTGQEALHGMRAMLDTLDPDTGERRPAPGLADLGDLLDRARAAGLTVHDSIDDLDVPAATGLIVHRVVQESVTNVLKHVGPQAAVSIRVTGGTGTVDVVVSDDGGLRLPPRPGRGLTGMRERVEALGGSFGAGPGENGFTVRAIVPTTGEPG